MEGVARSESREGMAVAKMSVAELRRFLHEEFSQAFGSGDITIQNADGETCLLRQRYSDRMLRPGGHRLRSDADGARRLRHVCGAALGHGPGRAGGDDKPQHQLSAKGGAGRRPARRGTALKLGKRLAVGEVSLLSGTSADPIAHATVTYSIPAK
jgi:hypothetical protein